MTGSKLSRVPIVKSLFFILLALIFSPISCTVPFDLDDFGTQKSLVVDGYITDIYQQQEIKITYSSAFSDGIHLKDYEENAQVFVQDDLGNRIPFIHDEKGVYLSDAFAGLANRTYQLFIQIGEEVYASSIQELPNAVPKPELSFKTGERAVLSVTGNGVLSEKGAVISANIPQATAPTYYHWTFDNYFMYVAPDFDQRSDLVASFIELEGYQGYDFLTDEQRDALANFKDPLAETCYIQLLPTPQVIILESLTTGGGAYNVEIDFIKGGQKFIFDFAVRANQLITNRESYLYWKQIREQIENVGGVFDVAPGTIQGNIINNSTGEFALGYFGVYRQFNETFFFNNEELGANEEALLCETLDRVALHFSQLIDDESKPWGDCISCLERGGGLTNTHKKPDWWR